MKFKKNCAALLASVIAAAAFPANLNVYAEGENVRSGNYVYSVNEDGTITFENYVQSYFMTKDKNYFIN